MLAALLIVLKAMQIQLIDTSYRQKANATATQKNVIYPSRGVIYDRTGKLLVNNNPMYDLMVTYNQVSPEMDTAFFCQLLDIDTAQFLERLNKDFKSNRYTKRIPFTFMSKITAATYARLQENMHEFPGFFVRLRNVRGYPHKNAAHVLGYLYEVDQNKIDKSEGKYVRGDYIGASGLELAYEEDLRGSKGIQNVMKDNLGRVVGPYKNGLDDSLATSGLDLISGIDLDVQAYGELLMQNKTGSIVAIEPSSGEILAMISTPTYDPNRLVISQDRGKAYTELLSDTLNPFFDRSVMAKYPPGSIFKTLVGLIAMQEGVLRPNRGISCSGAYYYKGVPRKCHSHPYAHNLATAIKHSCNTYFFNVIRDLLDRYGFSTPQKALDEVVQHLYDFGLGKPLDVDFPNEARGNVPTSEYYDHLYPKKLGSWKSPTIMSIGIGQGEIQMTTLQMANLAATIANRGFYYIPHLAKRFKNSDKTIPAKYLEKKQTRIDPIHFESVIDGMEAVVTGGTGRIGFMPDISFCGKTGTSQNPHGEDHSVFFGFAPKDNPQIAVAVYVEHGKWGASYAAPIASLIVEKYINRTIAERRKALEKRMVDANLIKNP